MGRSHSRSSSLSLGRSLSRVRVGSPVLQRKKTCDSSQKNQRIEFLSDDAGSGGWEEVFYDNGEAAVAREGNGEEESGGGNNNNNNKVMVVVDSSLDSQGALEWALSHTIQNQDTIILLHVTKSSNQGGEIFLFLFLFLLDFYKTPWIKHRCYTVLILRTLHEICAFFLFFFFFPSKLLVFVQNTT